MGDTDKRKRGDRIILILYFLGGGGMMIITRKEKINSVTKNETITTTCAFLPIFLDKNLVSGEQRRCFLKP